MKTKLLFIIILMLFVTSNSFSQEFQGKACYKSKTTVNVDLSGRNMPEDRKQKFIEQMKKANEKNFTLNFNQTESIYNEEAKLEQVGTEKGRRMRPGMSDNNYDNYYKNIKEGTYAVKNDLLGKIFLVQDKLPKLDWQMTNESKKIGKYTAFKATTTQTIKRPNMAALFNRNPKGTNQEEYIEKDILITAWYTPEIPVNHGPGNYWGLPGLILEASDDITTILCYEISINPKDKIEIKAPSKGKVVSQEEYDKISKAKMLEMRETFKNNRNGRGSGGRR